MNTATTPEQPAAAFLTRFWGHAITTAEVAKNYLGQIRSRMLAEGAVNDSDAEIERTLMPCVGGHLLVPVARYLRASGYALLGYVAGYPFEVTLPLWSLPDLVASDVTLPGVPVLPKDVGMLVEAPSFYRTYNVRRDRWGEYPEQERLHAVFQRQDGTYTDVKNPHTLALLRGALGLDREEEPPEDVPLDGDAETALESIYGPNA